MEADHLVRQPLLLPVQPSPSASAHSTPHISANSQRFIFRSIYNTIHTFRIFRVEFYEEYGQCLSFLNRFRQKCIPVLL